MQRTFHWSWLGAIALAAGPTVAAAQDTATAVAQDTSTPSHTVREGDTLWDLARQYRGDPFLWPDIYRMNTSVVEDPHWIYPGEMLRLSTTEAVASVPAEDTPPPAQDSAGSAARSVSDEVAESPAAGTEAVEQAQAPASLASLTQRRDAEESEPLFGPRPGQILQETLKSYNDQSYRPLRRSEFYSSGFLSENQKLPFGKMLGPVTPPQIRAVRSSNALPYATVAVSAPKGATYQVGDSLLVVRIGREVRHYGELIIPSGMIQVTDTSDGRYVASVIAVYGPIRAGQSVLPLEKFGEPGSAKASPVSDGVRATLLGGAGRQDLKVPQMVVFLDKGRQDGVAPGDLFEVRRQPGRLSDGTIRIDEVMATLQVVHVRERSATARLLNIVSPDIAPGTEARQVAKLP